PLGVGLVGQEVAAVQRDRVRQRLLGGREVLARERVEPAADRRLELVGVDPDRAPVELVAAVARGDERRGLMLAAVRLQTLAQEVDRLPDVGASGAARLGPEDLDQLVERDRAAAVADQVLQELAGAMAQPVAGQRALAALQARASERVDAQ